jgi:hypothetical protein
MFWRHNADEKPANVLPIIMRCRNKQTVQHLASMCVRLLCRVSASAVAQVKRCSHWLQEMSSQHSPLHQVCS